MPEKQKEEKELTAKQNLQQMKEILQQYVSQRKHIGKSIKKTTRRLEGAAQGPDILIRRFHFDLNKLYEELNQIRGREAWARRMIKSIEREMHTRNITLIVDGDLVRSSELIHRPFEKALTRLQL